MTKSIGVIGLGSIGMRHAKNLIEMGHTVVGFDPEKIGDGFPSIWPLPHGQYPEYDGVVLALPSDKHCAELLETPHRIPVFIEKPIGVSERDRVYIWGHLQHRTAPVVVGNNLRFHPCVKKTKEWLDKGLIGKPLWANFCVAQHNTKYTDPVVLNWGAHEVDLALHLLGPATVTAAAGNDRIFDLCLLHEFGVLSAIHMDYVSLPFRRGFVIAGSEGIITANLENRHASLVDTNNKTKRMTLPEDAGFLNQDYKDEMQAFIDLIDGKLAPHAATGRDGLNVLEVILEAQKMAS